LPRAFNLDGSSPGDYGFDPFYLSSIPKNFAGFLQPPSWEKTQGLPTLYWMRESEIKHCRVAMLAVVGWIATDFGVRFPGAGAPYTEIPNGYLAHNTLVPQGSMTVMLLAIGLIELTTGAALVQVSKGELEGREPGDFNFDPLNLMGKTPDAQKTMRTKEINNGRLAMLAFGGIATQAALGESTQMFPYF
jgi:Chlorophyll A-B binding protein